jgi:hypothetical protein
MPSAATSETVDLVPDYVCLERLFPDERGRPSIRWFRALKAAGVLPFRRIGRRIFYDVAEVRRTLDRKFKVEAF